MELPLISAALAGVLIVLQTGLMLSVGLHRTRLQVGVGTGDDMVLERKIRRHGNLTENAALFVAALALAELTGASPQFVAILAGAFFLARCLHAMGFSSEAGSHLVEGGRVFLFLRAGGAFLTAGSAFALGGYLVYVALSTVPA